jgi:hypothetical protein
MRKEKNIIAITAAAGLAGIAYALWPKRKVPADAIVAPLIRNVIWEYGMKLPVCRA